MSTLTVTLILLVAATLIAVAGVNLLQTWRARGPRKPAGSTTAGAPADRGARNPPADNSQRGEPSLGLDDGSPAHPPSGTDDRAVSQPAGAPPIDDWSPGAPPTGTNEATGADVTDSQPAADPVVPVNAPVPAAPRAAGPARVNGAALGDLSDCIVELPLLNPLAGERLLAMAQSFRRVGAKPILSEGLPRDDGADPSSARWAPLNAGVSYTSLRLGVLLANRHGPLNAMEFSEFIAGVNALGEHLSVLPETADMNAVLERARKLDSACIQLDAQIGVNVECAQAFSPGDLARIAADLQLVERGNNRYARLNPAGQVLFSVSLADQPNRLTFLLDVPRAPQQDAPWESLVATAQECAQRLDGALVDDGSRPLSPAALGRIGDQLAQRYDALEQAGFPAGSPLALRLFN